MASGRVPITTEILFIANNLPLRDSIVIYTKAVS